MTTDKDLVELLQSRNNEGRYDQLIANAKNGDYHTFKNKNGGLPKLTLTWALHPFPELKDVRDMVLDGVFDESIFDEDPSAKLRLEERKNSLVMLLEKLKWERHRISETMAQNRLHTDQAEAELQQTLDEIEKLNKA